MQRRLAGEGLWVEPASAAGMAGLASQVRLGQLDPKGKRIVAVCTGHGLKDPGIITQSMASPIVLPPDLAALEEVLLGDGA
jgi:threonine synthase